MKFTLFAAFLFSIGWMSVALAVDGPPVPCCLTVTQTRIPAENIVKYDIQNKTLCPVKAVRFHTKKDKVICSDPNSNWAKKVMKILGADGITSELSQKPSKCYTSTTNMIPTTATTDETSGTETEASTSTTVTPAVTTIETSTQETELNKSTILPTSVSTDKPESITITCGTGETPAPPSKITRVTNTTEKKKLSKMMIRKLGKSRKGLRRVQMGIPLNSTSGYLKKT